MRALCSLLANVCPRQNAHRPVELHSLYPLHYLEHIQPRTSLSVHLRLVRASLRTFERNQILISNAAGPIPSGSTNTHTHTEIGNARRKQCWLFRNLALSEIKPFSVLCTFRRSPRVDDTPDVHRCTRVQVRTLPSQEFEYEHGSSEFSDAPVLA